MLWTDRLFITTDELKRMDSEVQSVAETTNFTLEGDYGVIRAGIEEASVELRKLVIAFGGYSGSGDVSANHLAAVLNTGQSNSIKQKASLSQVVVSGEAEFNFNHVKQWAAMWVLYVLYRDTFNRTVQDRYEGKMRYYKNEINRRITPSLLALGIPIVVRPLAAPGAVFERDSGTWGTANLTIEAGGTLLPQKYRVAITYVDMSAANLYSDPSSRGNAESHRSEEITVEVAAGEFVKIDITSLNPPTGVQHPSQALACAIAPLKATHWNVYAGLGTGLMFLQNAVPIEIDTKTFNIDASVILSGPNSGLGQYNDRLFVIVPARQRA